VLRSLLMGFPPANPTPQFATAEYAGSGDVCKSCNQAIPGTYYRINGSLACERCTTQLQTQLPKDSHAAFVRALTFGLGAAILGLIGYAAFTIITGIAIGYISLAVGWLIGNLVVKAGFAPGFFWYLIFTILANLTYIVWSIVALVRARKGRFIYFPLVGRFCFGRYYGPHAEKRRDPRRWENKPPEGY